MNVFACWNVKGQLSVNENKVEVNQKIDHDKTYTFSSQDMIYHLKVLPHSKDAYKVEISVVKKVGLNLNPISTGLMIVKSGQEAIMTKKDSNTNELSTFKIKLSEI